MAPPVLTEHTFKDAVKTFVALHDELCEQQKSFRDLRRKKGELAEAIMNFMKTNGIDEFQVGDGKLMRKASKRIEGLKRDQILNTLKAALADDERAEACLTQMYATRGSKETETLRRTRQGKTTAGTREEGGIDPGA
jgi:hypothetical protein